MIYKYAEYKGRLTEILVCTNGTVTSFKGEVKLYDSGSGYTTIALCKGLSKTGKVTTIREYLHRLVAKTFIPNPDNLPQVNHKDGDKSNNHVDNLEWISNSANIKHAHANGLTANRAKVKPIRLSKEDAAKIYTRVLLGESISSVATSLNRPRTTISSVINKRCHKDTTDEIDRKAL